MPLVGKARRTSHELSFLDYNTVIPAVFEGAIYSLNQCYCIPGCGSSLAVVIVPCG
jgi:hypothetical protein